MQLKEFNLNLDIKKNITVPAIAIVQGDNSNVFNITLVNGSNSYDLTNSTVQVVFKKPDKTIVLQDATITDAENGLISCTLEMQVSAAPGTVSAEVIVTGPSEEKLTTGAFRFEVRKALLDEELIVSENLFFGYTNCRGVIYDTDWGSDVDDVVAARVMLWAERMGYVDIVAIVTSVAQDNTSPSMDAFFQEEGRPGLTIGADKVGGTGYNITPTYQTNMLANYPHTWNDLASMEDSTSVYRRAFANANKPIDIVVVGFLNAIEEFLKSPADGISPLTGMELVQQNGGTLWSMGGGFPNGGYDGYNYDQNKSAAEYVINNYPNEIVFSELGSNVWTGWQIGLETWWQSFDIVVEALNDHGSSGGRPSWDPLLMWIACMNDFDMCGVEAVQGIANYNGTTGEATFTESTEGDHYGLVQLHADRWYERELNSIIERIGWPYRKLGAQQLERL